MPDSAPASPDPVARPALVLRAGADSASVTAGRVCMDWTAAQQDGHRRFGLHDRFLCLPARFPSHLFDHQRETMCLRLRQRILEGCLAIMLVPPPSVPASAIDDDWDRAAHVIEAVARIRLDRVEAASTLEFTVLPTCPPLIAAHLASNPRGFRLQVTTDVPACVVAEDEVVVLAAYEDAVHEPGAAVVFAGAGACAILPWAGDGIQPADVECLMSLFDEVVEMRRAHDVAEAARRAEVEARWREIDDQRGEGAPRPRSPKPRGRAASEVPEKSLKGRKLYAVARGGTGGFLQCASAADGEPRTSALLGGGAWVVMTVLLDATSDEVEIAEVEEALQGADVPSENRSSLSSYLTRVRAALRSAVEAPIRRGAITVPRRTSVIRIKGLRETLRALGGAEVVSIRRGQ
jgi:hypothetical protein